MGPCLFRHGKIACCRDCPDIEHRLQWGHVFSDMVRIAASSNPVRSVSLQWGHVFSDMVSRVTASTAGTYVSRLQWGHVFSDMVSYPGRGPGDDGSSASMGPCLFRHGKVRQVFQVGSGQFEPLQWGHVFSDMVSRDHLFQRHIRRPASMGPCLFRHGKARSRTSLR